jgi:hypothetical protein
VSAPQSPNLPITAAWRVPFQSRPFVERSVFTASETCVTLSEGGALGVYAHVDRAWGYSFLWGDDEAVADVETFRCMLSALMSGKPAGAATDYFGMRYCEISAVLTEELDSTTDQHQDELKLAWWWISNHQASNYTFIGDPAVRLAVAR